MELERDEILTIDDLNGREIEALLELDSMNDEFEIELDSPERDELIELKAELDLRRETYSEFYEFTVKDVIREFIETQNMEGVVSFEARLKRDKSVKNSLDRKDIKLASLKDYLGLRFITKTRDDAYTIAGLFMMNHCIPRGMEEELGQDDTRFNAYETRDYFVFFFDNQYAQVYDKQGFVEGDHMDFRNYIEEKLGLTMPLF